MTTSGKSESEDPARLRLVSRREFKSIEVAGIESPLDELVDVETDSEIHQEDAAIVRRAAEARGDFSDLAKLRPKEFRPCPHPEQSRKRAQRRRKAERAKHT